MNLVQSYDDSVFFPGYFSEEGALAQTECPIATYAPNGTMSACAICPAGFYCDETRMTAAKSCPAGQYCPEGSHSTNFCPPGTYSNK